LGAVLRRIRPTSVAFVALAIAIMIYPVVFSGPLGLGDGTVIAMMAIGTLGFTLLIGYARQLAVGLPAFSMIGGYGNAILCARYGWDPISAMIASALLAMLIGWTIGWPLLRLRGFVLAMASLAFQLILGYVATIWVGLTGGAVGVTGIPRFSVFGWQLSNLGFYVFAWLMVITTIAVGLNIDRSRVGRSLRAIASSEAAAGSVGIDMTSYKVQMLVVGAAAASICGSLFAHYLRVMDPDVFGFQFSLTMITQAIIGGMTSIWGGVLGAALIMGLNEALRYLSMPLWEFVILGTLTILVLIVLPRSVAGLIADLWQTCLHSAPQPALVNVRGLALDPREIDPLPSVTGPLLSIRCVSKSFGNVAAVSDVGFDVEAGNITALIGPNGAGKTTLFNLISGVLPLDSGTIHFSGQRIDRLPMHTVASLGIMRTYQQAQIFDNMTVLENVICGRHRLMRTGLLSAALRWPSVAREERDTQTEAERWLAFTGLFAERNQHPSALPFGHQRLLELARALIARPSLLLMDEPSSGLNEAESERMAELILEIRAMGTTIVLVEHDVPMVMGLADQIVVMNNGEKLADGAPAIVRADERVIAAYLGS
jgi:branched-chain amino acid transport system permease protein